MEKKVVFFDLDGTLLNEEKVVAESTKKAIQALQDKGVYTVICTGRAPLMFKWLLDELAIDSYVSMNGQHVVFEGQELFSNPMDTAMLHELATFAKTRGHGLGYSNHDGLRVNAVAHPLILSSLEGLKIPYPEVEEEFYSHSPVHQVQVYCGPKDIQQYTEQFPTHTFISWSENALDMLPAGASKAIGVQKVLEHLQVPIENSYAFGDGPNDFEMLDYVGTGIAMGNALPELKETADYVTGSCSEDGILHGLIHVGLLEPGDVEINRSN